MTKDIDSEMFKYMLDHKADFVKSNGENRSISLFLISMLELFIHMHLEKRFITVKNC